MFRYLVAAGVQKAMPATFPAGTLTVNLLGCLVIGAFAGLAEAKQWTSPEVWLFVVTGVLGGFTTFSAFGYETFLLLREGEFGYAAASVLANVAVGFGAVGVGWATAKFFAA
jgi:CrcB protein